VVALIRIVAIRLNSSNRASHPALADPAAHRPLPAIEAALTFVAHKIHIRMPTVIKSEAFAEWIDNLRDRAGVARCCVALLVWSAAILVVLHRLVRV
jgi:hypothetical protein